MMNKKFSFILVALAFIFALTFAAQSQAGETYKMGCSLAITGPTSDAGSPYSKGVARRGGHDRQDAP